MFAIASERSMECGFGGAMYGNAANAKRAEHYKKYGALVIPLNNQLRVFFDEKASRKILEEYTYEKK